MAMGTEARWTNAAALATAPMPKDVGNGLASECARARADILLSMIAPYQACVRTDAPTRVHLPVQISWCSPARMGIPDAQTQTRTIPGRRHPAPT
eukprot:4007297-Alexandrium_andersonii.AAC.1